MKGNKRNRWIVALLVFAVVATGAARWSYITLAVNSPQALFSPTTVDSAHIQDPRPEDGAGGEETEKETVLPDIVNIMLIGIDAYENGGTTSGTEPHADVCMVLAINFKTNKIDLVSLPRDTFTTTPGYYGYYKLNCTFNVGGGLKDPDGGFQQVCRTAEQLMGGVSIPYYYAVDFQAVVELVDAVGGIDFEVDTPFHTLSGKYYPTGLQHLDGDGVMGYLRIRTEADGLDTSRTERQRKMLVALFDKLKSENKITRLLSVLGEVYDDIYTNTSLTQTIALLNYAAGIGVDNITTRSMKSPTSANYIWFFAFVDQQYRLDLIRELYGFDARPLGYCTTAYESWVHDVGFPVQKALRQGEKVQKYYEERQAAGETFSQNTQDLYSQCVSVYTELLDTYEEADGAILAVLGDLTASPDAAAAVRETYADRLTQLCRDSRKATSDFASYCGYTGRLTWGADREAWPWDTDINEVTVDFN